eukprot:7331383-Pyramimonas_sp.AAC.1
MGAAFLARVGHCDREEGLAEIISLEWITDLFDHTVSEEVRTEATAAKAKKAMRTEFMGDYSLWKDISSS